MIKANELRIGNLVHPYNEPKHTMELTSDRFHEWLHSDAENEAYSPVLLTYDVLQEFEFYPFYNDLEEKGNIFISANSDLSIECSMKGKYTFKYGNNKVEIKYLHQLQNLYFALTGQELTINLQG